MHYTNGQIARIIHEANCALQLANGDPNPSPHWDTFPEAERNVVVQGVVMARAGATAEELHEGWCEQKRTAGWVHGPVKDAAARTHPCLVPYAELPEADRAKDDLFFAIVHALAPTS